MSKSHLIVPKPILQIVLLTAGSALCLAPPLPAQSVTGQGTAGKIAKFTGASTIGNSVITESSTRIGIGTNTPASKLTVIANNSANATILGRNTGSGPGVSGTSTNGSPGVSGTAAQGTGVIGNGILGVYGQGNNGGSGVYGNSSAGVGVYGNSVNSDAVYGNSTNGIGVHGVGSQAGSEELHRYYTIEPPKLVRKIWLRQRLRTLVLYFMNVVLVRAYTLGKFSPLEPV